jgi:hypothetical protein
MRQAKPATDQTAAREHLLDLLGRSACRYVKILGRAAKQQVTYASTNDVSFVACLLQLLHNFSGMRTEFCAGNAVF